MPTLLTPEDCSAQQWATLVSILRSEMPSPGRLQSLKDVRQSAQLWTAQVPAVGVQLLKTPCTVYGQGRLKMVSHFLIITATVSRQQVDGSNVIPANLDDAMAQLQALLSDGAGNGISAVLRDPANFLLGGYAYETMLGGTEFFYDVEPSPTPDLAQIWAYGHTAYTATQLVATR